MHHRLDLFTNRLAWSLSRYVQLKNASYTNPLLETDAPCEHVTYWDHYDCQSRTHVMQRLNLFMSCIDQHQANTGEILPEDKLVPELIDTISTLSLSDPSTPFQPLDALKAIGVSAGTSHVQGDVLQTYMIATEMAESPSVKLAQVTPNLRPFWGAKVHSLSDLLRGTSAAHVVT